MPNLSALLKSAAFHLPYTKFNFSQLSLQSVSIGLRSNLQHPASLITFLQMSDTNPKIYIVDDDESVRRALSRLMKSVGYNAETFNSAQTFFDSVPVDTQGILILDVRMPDMDGFQVQAKLNALHSKLKIIFITAHAQAGDRERAMATGAKGFLQKPFSDESLLGLIDSITSEER